MISPSEHTERFRDLLKDNSLRLYLSTRWASMQNDYRLHLRRALFETIRDLGDQMSRYQQLLALEVQPTSEKFAISVSHAKPIGGFALSEDFPLIGFDLEEVSRVEERIAQRMVHPESSEAPSPAHLWTAQEAAFKALNRRLSLSVLSQIRVSNWTQSGSNSFIYTASAISNSNTVSAQGACIKDDDIIYSVLISR